LGFRVNQLVFNCSYIKQQRVMEVTAYVTARQHTYYTHCLWTIAGCSRTSPTGTSPEQVKVDLTKSL